MAHKNYYDILGVSTKASLDEITAAKNALAKKYHPDVNLKDGIDTTEQMQEILEAYRILSDPAKRKKYDRKMQGRTAVMQTFDLQRDEEHPEKEEGFIIYWSAAGELYDIILERDDLFHQKQHRPAFLLTLYDEHTKKEISVVDKMRLQKQTMQYQHSVKKLLRY